MNVPPMATSETVGSEAQGRGGPRQNGGLLLLTRIACIVVIALALGLFVVTLPTYFAHLHAVCTTASCLFGQLSASATPFLFLFGLSLHTYAVLVTTLIVIATLLCVVIAVLLIFRRSDNWMALLVAVLLVVEATSNSTADASVLRPWLGSILAVPVADTSNYLGAIAPPLIFSLFPTGRFVPSFMRWLVLALLIYGVILTLPFSPPAFVLLFSNLFWLSCLLGLAGAQIYRYRRVSTPVERQQTKWVIFGFSLTVLLSLLLLLPGLLFPFLSQPHSPYYTLWTLIATFTLTLSMVLSLGLAILRYRLWDIDIIINRTLVYGVLTISVVGIYTLVVGGLGTLLQAQGNLVLSLLATGLVAVLFQPLRMRLQRTVNRLMYGERDDPYRVISRLGQRLAAVLAPEAVLPTIVETVAQTLKLPYAAITLKQGEEFVPVASHGTARGEVIHLPLVYQAEQVGELVLAPRAPGESFTPADRRLLEDLARQAGVAVHAVRLTEDLKRLTVDLQRSRERLVTAREEERRRLRRDLHDGLGPQLASLTLKLETARNRLVHDPLADTLLSDLTTRTQTAVADIRRLVYALRPPVLDELGLVAALHEQALQYTDQGQSGLSISLDAPDGLPELSAAVEVAAYRIVQEALTNVVRHAQARHCTLCLALDEAAGTLTVEVRDDGRGWSLGRKNGIGLTSMRERAEELGGRLSIEPVPGGGLAVCAQLPCLLPSLSHDVSRHLTQVHPQEA